MGDDVSGSPTLCYGHKLSGSGSTCSLTLGGTNLLDKYLRHRPRPQQRSRHIVPGYPAAQFLKGLHRKGSVLLSSAVVPPCL
ncbi:hypothetical protein GDO81_025880 [Engystomops pustulosus]|uniref:Uncharacterized protein n=1 Tax=Engystomops pustulosus TaxID=76066 RepID=A0AAV6YI74_ENGPU|nr:hypothetical protein GDO81_025880 [Engystomops pustulosus]